MFHLLPCWDKFTYHSEDSSTFSNMVQLVAHLLPHWKQFTYYGWNSSAFGIKRSGTPKNFSVLSPYLNFDPAYLPEPSQPEFIFPEGTSKQRGRFELAFSQIGASCMLGAGIGGAGGFYNGLRTTMLEGQTGKLRRTQLLNHIMKRGAVSANMLGVIAVMYSGFGVVLQLIRGCDDEANTLVAATATGMLFRSMGGLKRCAYGGAVGFGLASVYCLWVSRDKLRDLYKAS